MFVFLAVVFALGFVFLGIGSGSNGITDALQNAFNFGHSGNGTSISSLERKTQKDPLDAQAWRDLATAYETKHRTDDAIVALSQYVGLRSHDTGALAELASEYSQQAQQFAVDYQTAQQSAATFTPVASAFAPPSSSPLGKALSDPKALQDPISTALQGQAQDALQTALTNYQTSQRNAEQTYQKLVKQTPADANAQLQLAQAAQAAADTKVALAAYQRFLALAPNDPLAAGIRKQVAQLKRQLAPASTSTTTTK
jgi:cytochrome c-type biogenesis protein CcmH/NrfG